MVWSMTCGGGNWPAVAVGSPLPRRGGGGGGLGRRTGTRAAGVPGDGDDDEERVRSCGAGSCWRRTNRMTWTYCS